MIWGARFKDVVTRNWREKVLAVVLAFLFWYMIKVQVGRSSPYLPHPPSAAAQNARL
jgi:hypothetical protein